MWIRFGDDPDIACVWVDVGDVWEAPFKTLSFRATPQRSNSMCFGFGGGVKIGPLPPIFANFHEFSRILDEYSTNIDEY